MAQIKGTVLLDTLAAIRARAGEAELAKIIDRLNGETKQLFQTPIQRSSWYSLDAFAEFLEANVQVTAGGDYEVLSKRAELVVESQLRGIYRVFVKLGTPGFVIDRIAAVHETYFKDIQIIPEIEKHKAVIKYRGFQRQHAIMQYVITGFYRKALELCGAQRFELKFTVPMGAGEPYAELSILWE